MIAVVAALVVAAAAVAVAIVRPVWFASVGFLVLVMAKSLDVWSSGALSYADEVICLVALVVLVPRRLIRGQGVRWLPGLGWFAAFAVFGVASGILVGDNPTSIALGGFLALKGLLFGFGVVQIDWNDVSVARLARAGGWVLAVLLVAVAANAVAPEWWADIFTAGGNVDYLLGLPSLTGLFVHPGDLGLVLAVSAIAVLAYRHTIGGGWKSLVLFIGSLVGALSSLRRKTLAGLIVAIGWLTYRSGRFSRVFAIVLASVVVVIAVAGLAAGVIQHTVAQYVVSWQDSPRSLMALGTFDVAGRYFPFGAGFGRYGSYLAEVNYSPEYVRLGFAAIANTAPGSPYLLDTQWPAIFGEAGWIGGAAYAIGMIRIWVALSRAWRTGQHRPWLRFVGLVGTGWMVQVLLESVAGPVLVASPGFPLVFFVVAIAASMMRPRPDAPGPGPVDRLVIYQFDPQRPSLGGVDTCVRGLATYYPEDHDVAFVGVDATGAHELGVWARVTVASTAREIWFLPVARLDPDNRRRLVPHGISLVAGLWRYRQLLPASPLVQAHKLESAAFVSWLRTKSALVYFIHSQRGALAAPGSDSRWRFGGRLQSRLERRLVARAKSVVVFNRQYADELEPLNDRVHFSPTWFDTGLIEPHGDHDPRSLLWVGRIEPPKDARLAVSVLESLHRLDDASWQLTIVGSGSEVDALRDRVASLPQSARDSVRVIGAVPPQETARLMSEAGVLLMTSVAGYEGFPRVLVEGLASGLPAVVTDGTDTGALIEVGKNGFVCGRDPDELARAVLKAPALDRAVVRDSVSMLDGQRIIPHLFTLTATDALEAARA